MRYLLFHKPYRVLSQFTAGSTPPQGTAGDRPTLANFITIPNVYPVGRLDWDSEGLMLLTDDGPLQHRLSHPQFGHERTYWAQVERIPDPAALDRLQRGLKIQNYVTRPAIATRLDPDPDLPPRDPPIRFRQNIPTAWIALTLTEGRNRQVRRMTAAVGFPTLRLVRVAIGPLRLDGLAPGQWRDLTEVERRSLLAWAKAAGQSARQSPRTTPGRSPRSPRPSAAQPSSTRRRRDRS
jgi:23S rRNA pseudouridine2457 synthase